jgi:hypothetical protein
MKRLSKKTQFSPTGIVLSSVLALSLGCSIGCSDSGPAKSVAKVANQQTVTFFVDGMV